MKSKYFTIALFLILLCELMSPAFAYPASTICSAYGYGSGYLLATSSGSHACLSDLVHVAGASCTASTELSGGTWYVWHTVHDGSCQGNNGVTYITSIEYPVSTTSPTPTPTPSESCVTKCGYTWTEGFTADDVLLQMCVAIMPLAACEVCGWQMAAMEEAYPCEVPPSSVPTYDPTPIPTVPPPPTIPTIVPGPNAPPQVITIGGKDIHDVDFTVPTIATIAIPEWDRTSERNNITSVIGNITDPYLNGVDAFSVAVSLVIQHIMYLPNWVMATIYTTVQPIATAFTEIIVIVSEWGSVPLQLMRLALDNIPAGIQALLIYGVCLEMVIYLLRGDT